MPPRSPRQHRGALPPPGATATLQQGIINLGPAAEAWPEVRLAKVEFTQPVAGNTVVEVVGNATAVLSPKGVIGVADAHAEGAPPITTCRSMAEGHYRRIFFGVEDPSNPNSHFGLGYEEVDQNDAVVPGTGIPVSAFDPARTTVCLPLGPRRAPVFRCTGWTPSSGENELEASDHQHRRQQVTQHGNGQPSTAELRADDAAGDRGHHPQRQAGRQRRKTDRRACEARN